MDFDQTLDLVELREIVAEIERGVVTRASDGHALYDRLELHGAVDLPALSEPVWQAFVASGAFKRGRTTHHHPHDHADNPKDER